MQMCGKKSNKHTLSLPLMYFLGKSAHCMKVKSGLCVKRWTNCHVCCESFKKKSRKEHQIQRAFLSFYLTETFLQLVSARSIITTTWAIKIHLYWVPADRNPWYPTLTRQYDIQNISSFTCNKTFFNTKLHWMFGYLRDTCACVRMRSCACLHVRAAEIPPSQPCRTASYTKTAMNGWRYNHMSRSITHVAIISSKILNQ